MIHHLERMFISLLQWHYVPKQRKEKGSLWSYAFKNQQQEVKKLVEANPSLVENLDEIAQFAYQNAPWYAGAETDIDESVFPKICPWAVNDLLVDKPIEAFRP